jgi:hypothetical protein
LFRGEPPPIPLTVDELTSEQLEQLIDNVRGPEVSVSRWKGERNQVN